MTPEDLYRAIGNIKDEYLVIKKRRPFSFETKKFSTLYGTENTIDLGVAGKRKILPHLIAAVLVLAIGGAAVAAACFGLKKDRERDRKTIGYFREDSDFTPYISDPEVITSDGENLYFSGWNMDRDSWNYMIFYDYETGKEQYIKLDDLGADTRLLPFEATEDDLWFWSYDTNRDTDSRLVRANRGSGKVTGKIIISDNEDIIRVSDMKDGNYLIEKCIRESEWRITGYVHQIYDRKLNLVSEKKIMFPAPALNEGYHIAQMYSEEDGSLFAVFGKEDQQLRAVAYSAEGKELHCVDLNTENTEGYLINILQCRDGSLLLCYVFYHDPSNPVYYFEKYDTETGEVTAGYEFDLPGGDEPGLNMCRSESPDYDVMMYSYPYVYGINISKGENKVIADVSGCTSLDPDNTSFLIPVLSETGIMVTGTEYEQTDEYFGKRCFIKSDLNGKRTGCIGVKTDFGFGEKTYIKQARTADNGELQLLVSTTVEKSPDEAYEYFYFIVTDSELNIKKKVCLGPDVYSNEFIANDSQRILLYDRLTHDLVFSDAAFSGNDELKTAGKFPKAFFFKSGSDCYCLVPSSEIGKTVVYKADFENKTVTEADTLDFVVNEAEDGDGSYDAYFILENGVKGYKLSDGSCDDIVDWIDSGITETVRDVAVIDKDTLLIRFSPGKGASLKYNTKLYRRAENRFID